MHVGVVGVGAVGTRAVRQLVASPGTTVSVYDTDHLRAKKVAEAMGPGVRVAGDVNELTGLDVVLLAQPAPHHPLALSMLVAGASVVSVSDDARDAIDLLAVTAGPRTLIVGAGFSPGLSCLLARYGATRFDRVDEVHVAKHGTGGPDCARQHHRALSGTSRSWRSGGWSEQPAGSGRELCWFPEPIGGHDCYRAESAEPAVLHAGFAGVERITARVSATRRDRLTARLPMLRPPHAEGGLGAVRVELRGVIGGERVTEVLGVIDRAAIAAGAVAAVVAVAAGNGELPAGTFGLADPQLPTARLLVELARRGVRAARFTGTAQGGAQRSSLVV